MSNLSVTSHTWINAPTDTVFDYFVTLSKHYLWNPSIRELSREDRLSEGESYTATSIILKNVPITSQVIVEKLDENEYVSFISDMGTIHFKQDFRLLSEKGGTTIETSLEMLTKSQPFGLTRPVLKALAMKELKTDLKLLKKRIEEETDLNK